MTTKPHPSLPTPAAAPAVGLVRWLGTLWLAGLLAIAANATNLTFTSPGNMPNGRTITANELWEEFNRTLPEGVWISPLQNETYEVISAKWMRHTFLPSLRSQMRQVWTERLPADDSAGNCNGFALVCRLLLNMSAMSVRAPAPATATLIVRHEHAFGGLPATHEAHSVAWVLTDEGPWIIEVQSATPIPLRDYPNWEFIKMVNVH